MENIEIESQITPLTDEDLATILVGVRLAEWFIWEGHTADDLKTAIRTALHINLED